MSELAILTTAPSLTPNTSGDALFLGCLQADSPKLPTLSDKILNQNLLQAADMHIFKGETDDRIATIGHKKIVHLQLFGLGKSADYSLKQIRNTGARLIKATAGRKWQRLIVDGSSFHLDNDDRLQAFIEGMLLASYRFTPYHSKKADPTLTIVLLGQYDAACISKIQAIVNGVALARDCGNHPANVMTPHRLSEIVQSFSSQPHTTVKVIDVSEFEALGMGALYSVARGSLQTPAKFILCHYQHPDAKNTQPFALVGKGVTFDSGGISLKPGARMDEMKFDLCGAAAVLGTMSAITTVQPPWNVVMAIAATENMPGGNAQRPGDIVTAYNGKTIEILNTDAEGRLILADALSYVVKNYQPRAMVDLATLTGAVIVTLGHYASSVMGNDDTLLTEINAAAQTTHERVWPLPLWEEYCKDVESTIADVKNLGKGRQAGSIAGGAFLKAFVGETPWCHLDIAGTAWGETGLPYEPKNSASGVGVRLLYRLLETTQETQLQGF